MTKLLPAALLFAAGLALASVGIAGIKFENQVTLGAAELQLNGAGTRSKYFFKAYAVGLYLTERKVAAADVLALKGPKRLHIVTLRELSAEQFANALESGIQENHSKAEIEPLRASIDEFKQAMLAATTSAKGDVIDIDWLPDRGTRLSINGKPLGRDIAGEDFYRALLKIWLGDKPVQVNLKEDLLGRPQ